MGNFNKKKIYRYVLKFIILYLYFDHYSRELGRFVGLCLHDIFTEIIGGLKSSRKNSVYWHLWLVMITVPIKYKYKEIYAIERICIWS